MKIRFEECLIGMCFVWKSTNFRKNSFTTAMAIKSKHEPFEFMFRKSDLIEISDQDASNLFAPAKFLVNSKKMTTI